eukprot:m.109160 g.109160  ORF g.109160 m.109160 type:complete len:309 (-) comp10687_c1_seq3:1246-2172(-)
MPSGSPGNSNTPPAPNLKGPGALSTSTPFKGFAFSWVSVCVAESITLPTDTVKTRMQVQGELGAHRVYRHSLHAAVTIARSEGVAALWKGLGPALVRQSVYGTFRYGAYEPIKKSFGVTSTADFQLLRKVAAACAAGTIGSFIAVPCDLVKVQMMTDVTGTRYAGTLSAFRDIFRREGLAGMWRGTVPTCSRAAVGAMTELPVYDEIKTRLIADEYFTDGFQLHAVSALCAGLVSTFAMNPFDVAKSRVMNQKPGGPQYASMVDCLQKTVRAEGVTSLWKGFLPAYARVGPRVLIIFLVLEQLRAHFD